MDFKSNSPKRGRSSKNLDTVVGTFELKLGNQKTIDLEPRKKDIDFNVEDEDEDKKE